MGVSRGPSTTDVSPLLFPGDDVPSSVAQQEASRETGAEFRENYMHEQDRDREGAGFLGAASREAEAWWRRARVQHCPARRRTQATALTRTCHLSAMSALRPEAPL
jgi:hypothetical protein